jgi:hypothetical protein
VIDGRSEFIEDAHHAAHLEQPERSADLVAGFISPV